jgi:hypothetical protein
MAQYLHFCIEHLNVYVPLPRRLQGLKKFKPLIKVFDFLKRRGIKWSCCETRVLCRRAGNILGVPARESFHLKVPIEKLAGIE